VIGSGGGVLVGRLAVEFVPVGADRNQKHVHARTITVAQLSGVTGRLL
jgi:hypothetical protein